MQCFARTCLSAPNVHSLPVGTITQAGSKLSQLKCQTNNCPGFLVSVCVHGRVHWRVHGELYIIDVYVCEQADVNPLDSATS